MLDIGAWAIDEPHQPATPSTAHKVRHQIAFMGRSSIFELSPPLF
jgi:hypothetical protein